MNKAEKFINFVINKIENGIKDSEQNKQANKEHFEQLKEDSPVQKRIDKIKSRFKCI